MRGTRALAALAAFSLLAAACGSSTAYRQANSKQQQGGEEGEFGVGPDGKPLEGGVPGQEPGVQGTPGTTGTTGLAPGANGGDPTRPGPGTTTGPGPTGPGNTAPIRLGYVIADNREVEQITGRKAGDASAAEREMQALISWANKTGGIGGRKIDAKGYTISQTSNDSQRTAACVAMTEDDKREVVIDSVVFGTEASYACFAKHKTTFMGAVTTSSSGYLQSTAPYIMTTNAGLDREMQVLPQALKEAGYFEGEKVGVILDDIPNLRAAYQQHLVPAMQRAGVPIADVRFVGYEGTASEHAQMGNAVLDFKDKKIQRVIMFTYALNYLSFTSQARSQTYNPRYAYTDYMALNAVALAFGAAAQNANAMGLSTVDGMVVDDNSRGFGDTTPVPREKLSPGRQRCLDILSQETGRDYYRPQESGRTNVVFIHCDSFLLWLDTARATGPSWAPGASAPALRRLGTGFLTATQKATNFGTGRFDGASSYRLGKRDDRCNCYVKVIDWRPLP
ncbi:MAG TPA: ABC transporter substrate-binding protein [Acidimicrobiales bacterium]|nr:ABC transporter substrate-binding protein [Acidimicrobiales bacterium]